MYQGQKRQYENLEELTLTKLAFRFQQDNVTSKPTAYLNHGEQLTHKNL